MSKVYCDTGKGKTCSTGICGGVMRNIVGVGKLAEWQQIG